MKFLLDQNISRRVCAKISPVFGEVTSAIEQGLLNASDRVIWEFAKQHGYVLISQDKDHYDLSRLYGHPPKLIWLRYGNASNQETASLLLTYAETIFEFLSNDETGCLEIFRFPVV